MTRAHLTVLLTLAVAAAGCSSAEDEVRERLGDFKRAALWRDTEALYQLHVDSQGEGVICDARFADLFQKAAAASHTPETCAEAATVVSADPDARAKLDEKLVLMSDIIHFQCQHPDSACRDFSRDLFFRRAKTSPLLTRDITKIDVAGVFVRDKQSDTATAYLAVHFAGQPAPERITIDLTRQRGQWWITTYPW